ncbi:MAG TPA: hypothetical protein VMW63_05080 [Methanoregulaceae archaeon]|nr:hypothetical protein [Methanoregulaceae archaeon]
MITMNEEEIAELIRSLKLSTLKEVAKAEGIKPGRCPTKMSIARMLPEVTLKELSKR